MTMGRKFQWVPTVLILGGFLLAAPALAAGVDEVIAKHIEARGGEEAWAKIDSLRLSGDYTGFSRTEDFVLTKTKSHGYHLDHVLQKEQVIIGYDGDVAWWMNPWAGADWPQKVQGLDLEVLMQDVDFVNPLFRHGEEGFSFELLGETEVDGMPAIGIKVTRPSGAEETWYLDPDTHLETARDGVGKDGVNQRFPLRTFFDDFREVSGVMIPHFVETQWYTRDRIMEIDDIVINPEVDTALFAQPAPEGMEELVLLVGDWDVKVENRGRPGGTFEEKAGRATIETHLDGNLWRGHLMIGEGGDASEAFLTLSWDRFQERYRLARMVTSTTYLDIEEGQRNDEGQIVVSNVETGTIWSSFGRTFHRRHTFKDFSANGFVLEMETSVDGGENWFVNPRATFSRTSE